MFSNPNPLFADPDISVCRDEAPSSERGVSRRCKSEASSGAERVDQLEAEICQLSAHITAATYQLLVLLREFDDVRGWAADGIASCAHWLSWQTGIGLNAARERVRVAHVLRDLPGISAAFAAGEISYSKVRAITRVATSETEKDLLNVALHGTAHHVEKLVRSFRRFQRIEALGVANEAHASRSVTWAGDSEGSTTLKITLPNELAALVLQAIDRSMAANANDQAMIPDQLVTQTEDEVTTQPREPFAAQRADGLVRMAEHYLANADQDDNSQISGADRHLITIHVTEDTLEQTGETAEVQIGEHGEGGSVCAETGRRLACDASIVRLNENELGEPLDIGRRSRTISTALRRALSARDGGCRFPGCNHTRYVDAHHIHHWADGGETRLDNLVTLCRRHHRCVHEEGFAVRYRGNVARRAAKNDHFEFTRPDGSIIPGRPARSYRGNLAKLKAQNAAAGITINVDTGKCRWTGEKMDYDLAIQAMWSRT